jgi:release factor glutamine methyltransferase
LPDQQWTIRAALEWTIGYLERNNEENPRLAAQWLLTAATGLTRIELYTNYDLPLDETQRTALREGIKRRIAGEPLQYILGKAPFRRLEVTVRPGVLIPRPETEILVDVVLSALPTGSATQPPSATPPPSVILSEAKNPAEALSADTAVAAAPPSVILSEAKNPAEDLGTDTAVAAAPPLRILDLCTGTGCIALSFLHEYPNCHVTAIDIDPAAVELAQFNACELKLDGEGRLRVFQGDLATELLQDPINHAAFDVIVSNPPYIPTEEYLKLIDEVAKYEARIALDGGEDGLDVFRRILEQSKILLVPGGLLACELHETTLDQAAALCERQGFIDVTIHKDLTDKLRIITARKAVL